jgi:rifampicin phosphotransferase
MGKVVSATAKRSTGLVLPLSEAGTAGADRVGSKAANLGALVDAGFPVPDGFVLTVDAFERFLELHRADHQKEPDPGTRNIPESIVPEVVRVIDAMGDIPLAVRSSSIAEDLPDASYAGQYTTVLGARGIEEVLNAVRQCWESSFGPRAETYRTRQGEVGPAPVAVVIQRLVEADAAGVAFTANPITGDHDEVLVSAVRGLGERLVSGEASPDEWVVRPGQVESRNAPEAAVDQRQVVRIADLARRIEAHFGRPQDVEWVLAGDSIYVLQARPITTLPIPIEIDPPAGFWQRDSGHFSRPVSPMARSFYFETLTDGATEAFREFGALIDRIECREIGGHVYIRVVPLGGKEGPAPPWWVLGLVARIHPAARAAVKRAREAARTGKAARLIDRWWSEWRPRLFDEIARIQDVDLRSLADEDLIRHLDRTREFVREGNRLHFRLFMPYMLAVTDLIFFCRDELGWDHRRTVELVTGLSGMSTEPSRRLAELASMAATSPELREALESGGAESRSRLAAISPEFETALDDYQREFGCRALGEDIMEPTLGEKPELILSLVKEQIEGAYDAGEVERDLARRREKTAAEARRHLSSRPAELERFEHLLANARSAYPVREDNSFPTYQAAVGLMRYALLEIGSRLSARGVIPKRDDVMNLELPEARDALRNGDDHTSLIARRKGEYAWALANPGPSHYGTDPGPPPDMRALPAESRSLMEGLFWFIQNDLNSPPVEGDGICGVGASAGIYRGPVRVIRGEAEFHKLRNGDVLVCPITSPVWSVLFGNVGAMVTDTGGLLSHSAIIAREYGIPAVVNTGDATSVLVDGQLVIVDGGRGTVEVVDGD